jgi:apolipoprotein N-acyltransferase
MAMLRGVEHGYSVIRSARDGVMSVSDRYGRILAEAPTLAAAPFVGASWNGTPHGQTTLVASAPPGPGVLTLYDRGGWLFGWACLILAVLTRLAPARRGEPAESPGDLPAFHHSSTRSRR